MFELEIPLSQFLDRALFASVQTKYLAFVTIIARTADGGFLQDSLIRDWESLEDLTGDEILVLSPKSANQTHTAMVPT